MAKRKPPRTTPKAERPVVSPLENGGVFLGAIHGEMVHAKWWASIMKVLYYDEQHDKRLIRQGGWIDLQSSPRIASNRNIVISQFLNLPGQPEWLWMVDTDMTFEGDILDRMLAVAHWKERPVLGALAFAGKPGGEQRPTLYKIGNQQLGEPLMYRMDDYPRDQLVRVEGTGAACILMHRVALETVFDKWSHSAYPWFAEMEHDGKEFGEDVALMLKFHGCGVPVHVDTRIKVGHLKMAEMNEETYDQWRTTHVKVASDVHVETPAERQAKALGLIA